jgi:hypothetical protein
MKYGDKALLILLLNVKIKKKLDKKWLQENVLKISGFIYEIYREISWCRKIIDPWMHMPCLSEKKKLILKNKILD